MFQEMMVASGGGGGNIYYGFVNPSVTPVIDVGFTIKYAMYIRYDGFLNIYDEDALPNTVSWYSGSGFAPAGTATLPATQGLIRDISGSNITIYNSNEAGYLVAFG